MSVFFIIFVQRKLYAELKPDEIISGTRIQFDEECDKILYYNDSVSENIGYNSLFGMYRSYISDGFDGICTNGLKRILRGVINNKPFNPGNGYDPCSRYMAILSECAGSGRHGKRICAMPMVLSIAIVADSDKHFHNRKVDIDIVNI